MTKIVITRSARESLWPIYTYHCDYSEDYADKSQREIDAYIHRLLPDNPKLGNLFNVKLGIHRLIFQRRYNIYYTLRENVVYILFGPVTLSCRSDCSLMQPLLRRPRGFSSRVLNASVADCRSH